MKVILQLNAIPGEDGNQLAYMVKITQGADQITTEEDLLEELKNSEPGRRGVISIQRLSTSIWAITSPK